MGCNCSRKVDYSNDVRPNQQCMLCAEKHFATALALMREVGYEETNDLRIRTETSQASWHFSQFDPAQETSILTGNIKALIPAVATLTGHGEDTLLIIGELVLAGWHCAAKNRPLAMQLRDLRHSLQTDTDKDKQPQLIKQITEQLEVMDRTQTEPEKPAPPQFTSQLNSNTVTGNGGNK